MIPTTSTTARAALVHLLALQPRDGHTEFYACFGDHYDPASAVPIRDLLFSNQLWLEADADLLMNRNPAHWALHIYYIDPIELTITLAPSQHVIAWGARAA